MRTRWLLIATLQLMITACGSGATPAPKPPTTEAPPVTPAPPEVTKTLAPSGKLRVGLLLGNPMQIIISRDGELKGVLYDLTKDLAHRLGVPFEVVIYPTRPAVVAGGKAGEWDLSAMAFTAARETDFAYTTPYLHVELGFLVPAGSAISKVEDVDRKGVRVVMPEGANPAKIVTAELQNATVIQKETYPECLELVRTGQAEVFASNKPALFRNVPKLPGSRVLDGKIGEQLGGMLIPKDRVAAMPYLRKFVEDAKADGRVQAAIDRVGLGGMNVTPAAPLDWVWPADTNAPRKKP